MWNCNPNLPQVHLLFRNVFKVLGLQNCLSWLHGSVDNVTPGEQKLWRLLSSAELANANQAEKGNGAAAATGGKEHPLQAAEMGDMKEEVFCGLNGGWPAKMEAGEKMVVDKAAAAVCFDWPRGLRK
jgi:hypothetical protein